MKMSMETSVATNDLLSAGEPLSFQSRHSSGELILPIASPSQPVLWLEKNNETITGRWRIDRIRTSLVIRVEINAVYRGIATLISKNRSLIDVLNKIRCCFTMDHDVHHGIRQSNALVQETEKRS
jgi:hypothetical protein